MPPPNDPPAPPDLPTLAWAEGPAFREALAGVRGELLAIPDHEVESPGEGVAAFVREVLASCAAARTPAPGRELALTEERAEAIDHLELLALALARAQREHVFAPPGARIVDARLEATADEAFFLVEDAAQTLVRRGVVRARDLPRRRGHGRTDRCVHVLELVRVLRSAWSAQLGAPLGVGEEERARRLAWVLLSAGDAEDGPGPTALRDRAYTAVLRALARARVAVAGAPRRRSCEGSALAE